MSLAPIEDPPKALVEGGEFHYGRFSAPPESLNMLDVSRPYHYPIPRFAKDFRLKEWQAFQFGNERWFFFTALYTAKVMSLAIFYAYDRVEKKSHGFKRLIPGQSFVFSDTLRASHVVYKRSRRSFEATCAYNEGHIDLNVSNISRDPTETFTGRFSFACGSSQAAPLSVCLPLGLNRAMYSTKILMPMTGAFTLGGEEHRFEAPTAMGVIDDHKGYYPVRLRYDWVSGFGIDAKGRRVGFNLTDNQVKDQVRYNENCLWVNNRIYSLPPVKVTRPSGPSGEWIIQDTEGMVDLVFVPAEANDIVFNAGIIAVDYHGPFGSFRGIIKNGSGEKIDVENLFGAGEQKYMRA
jgi:hypothetical protein